MKTSYIKGQLLIKAMFMALIAVFASCQEDYKLELPLALTQEELTLGASGGSTHVLVYSTGNWTASLKDPADASWASIEMGSGKENGEFIFNYAKNPGLGRQAIIVITTGSETKELAMNQSGYVTAPNLALLNQNFAMPSWESTSSVPFTTNLDLALDRIYAIIDYGEFDTADGADNSKVETVRATEENPGWLTDIVVEEDTVRFKVAENVDGLPRVARLTLRATNETTNRNYNTQAFITQTATTGYMDFNAPEQPAEVESFAKTVSFLWNTNMETYFNKLKFDVAYDEPGEQWISNFKPTKTGLQADIAESTYSGQRHATITVTYNGPEGNVTATRKVVQAEPSLEVPFADLRARLTSAGTVTLERDYIMAQVISDPGNANLETNPQPTWKSVDLNESMRTAYIQSVDGAYGFRVKLADGVDASVLPRYATVKIALAGLTMEREDAPARYTLRGFNAGNILETTAGDASSVADKKIFINQLTDNDIYTLVTFKDVEVAFPYGVWGNMHNGFALLSDVNPKGNKTDTRCDCVPRFFRDANGSVIPMLINAQTPWRAEKYVPKGSGTATGIVVHSLLKRYNGNNELGTYQFRVMDRADIKLSGTNNISTSIAEWQWTGGASTIKAVEGSDSKIAANSGTGIMDTDAPLTGTKTALTTNFFSVGNAATGTTLAFRYNAPWWNFTANEGYSISWTFSTAGISGSHLTLVMTASGGKQAQPSPVPVYWDVEYSTDGTSFTTLKNKLLIYPSPIFAYEKGDAPAGNAEYVIDLPDALLGQQSVTVRIKAASKKYTTKDGLDKGTLKADTKDLTNYMRFDGIVIKYNK